MSKTPAVKLAPTVVRGAKAASTQAQQDGRKRPIVAINEDGKLVVCCRRTAKKNGWEVQDVLYERTKTVKAEAAPEPKKQRRRSTDKAGAVVVSKEALKNVKTAVEASVDELLGK